MARPPTAASPAPQTSRPSPGRAGDLTLLLWIALPSLGIAALAGGWRPAQTWPDTPARWAAPFAATLLALLAAPLAERLCRTFTDTATAWVAAVALVAVACAAGRGDPVWLIVTAIWLAIWLSGLWACGRPGAASGEARILACLFLVGSLGLVYLRAENGVIGGSWPVPVISTFLPERGSDPSTSLPDPHHGAYTRVLLGCFVAAVPWVARIFLSRFFFPLGHPRIG